MVAALRGWLFAFDDLEYDIAAVIGLRKLFLSPAAASLMRE
jgi:hypothetical protein